MTATGAKAYYFQLGAKMNQPVFLFLDKHPGALSAWSFRKLKTNYDGYCVKVRRSSDGAVFDIGFVNEELDTASLLSFVGSGDGFVSIWYDQSGNGNDIEITTSALQPKIVDAGVLVTGDTGKPALMTDGVDDTFGTTIANLTTAPALSIFIVWSAAIAADAPNKPGAYPWSIGATNLPTYTRFLGKGTSTGALNGEYMYFDLRTPSSANERLGSSTYRRAADSMVIETDLINVNGISTFTNGVNVALDLAANGALTSNDYTPANNSISDYFYCSALLVSSSSYSYHKSQKYSEIIIFGNDKTLSRQVIENEMSNFVFGQNLHDITPLNVSSNPYSGLNFSNLSSFKAELHCHTTQSTDAPSTQTPQAVLQAYSDLKYDILAITDHDTLSANPHPTWPLGDFTTFEPQTPGENVEFFPALNMLLVRGNELTGANSTTTHHRVSLLNGMWTDAQEAAGDFSSYKDNVEWTIQKVGELGGLIILPHPTWHSNFGTTYDTDWYVYILNTYPHVVGVEVKTGLTRNDEPNWDAVLSAIQSKKVWGFSNGDDHDISTRCGTNYNVLFMPELSENAFKNALINGHFYCVVDPLGVNPTRHNPLATPIISSINVNNDIITINATNVITIEWIADGGIKVEEGTSFDAKLFTGLTFVRAKLLGADGSVALTQPFGLM